MICEDFLEIMAMIDKHVICLVDIKHKQILKKPTKSSLISNTNHYRLAYCGTSLAETAHRGWTISVHPEDLPELLKQWEACVRAGQSFEKKFRLKCAIDGKYYSNGSV